jgi:nucleoside-diphosphate-sugar epimerase
MKRVLVTGGAGFVGSMVVADLLAHGYAARVLDPLMYGGDALLPFFFEPGFELVRGSVADEPVLDKALEGCDLVVHLAAIVGFPACRKHPELAMAVNVGGSKLLAQLAPRNVPIIYASTGSNYGAIETGICTEDVPLNPLSLYARTKVDAERILLERGNAVALRFATGFGVSRRLRLDLLVNDFVFQALKRKNLVVYEKGHMRSFIHVRDMSAAILFTTQNIDRMVDQVFNTGTESMNLTKEQICERLRQRLEFFLHYADAGKDEDARNYYVSYEKIRKLGFEPRIGLDRGIDELSRGLAAVEFPNPYGNV